MKNELAVIYKYPLETFSTNIRLPVGAIFLHAECQDDNPQIWFRVFPNGEKETREFCLIATGQLYEPMGMRYLQTITQGPFVWHVHERSHS